MADWSCILAICREGWCRLLGLGLGGRLGRGRVGRGGGDIAVTPIVLELVSVADIVALAITNPHLVAGNSVSGGGGGEGNDEALREGRVEHAAGSQVSAEAGSKAVVREARVELEATVEAVVAHEAVVGHAAIVGGATVGQEAIVGEAIIGEAIVGEAVVGEAAVGEPAVGPGDVAAEAVDNGLAVAHVLLTVRDRVHAVISGGQSDGGDRGENEDGLHGDRY